MANNNTTTNIGIGAFRPQTRPGRHLVDLTNIPAEKREGYANQVIHDLVEQHKLDRPVWFTVITEDANGKKQYKVPAGFEFERTGLPVPGFRGINPYHLKKYPWDDYGLAQLFYDVVLQGKILYNQESGVTYYYDGTKWVPDDQASTHFMACLRAFKNLLSDAMQYIDNEKFRESFKKSRYNRAISEGGGRVLLKLVKTLCGVKQSDFDADPYKISLYSYFLPKRRTQHMDMNIIQSAATEVLVNLSLAVISLAGAYAVYYIRLGASKLKAQTAQIEDESARKVLDNALADVENLATKSVGAMEQTTAKALRDAVKSGAANREDLLALGKQVFNEVKAAIAPEAQKVITDNLGSFDDYLTKCIEDAVLKVKQSDPFITLPEGVLLEGNTVTEEAAPSSKE